MVPAGGFCAVLPSLKLGLAWSGSYAICSYILGAYSHPVLLLSLHDVTTIVAAITITVNPNILILFIAKMFSVVMFYFYCSCLFQYVGDILVRDVSFSINGYYKAVIRSPEIHYPWCTSRKKVRRKEEGDGHTKSGK